MILPRPLLCLFGLHQWREERVLEKRMSSGIVAYLEDDVCQRCEALRDPASVANVYAMMVNMGDGETVMHPTSTRSHDGDKGE
jgi:hypothetical protein